MFLECICVILCILEGSFAQPSTRELDYMLQDYAFRELDRPTARTGVVYDSAVPENLTGIEVAALRLRSGSMRRKGFERYKDFTIPVGLIEQPYVERVVLVYHNLGNLSSSFYPLPGYTFLAPVLGLLVYDGSNLTATNLSQLDIRASGRPISVHFRNVVMPSSSGPVPVCAVFGLDGSVGFENVIEENTCLVNNQGHFSIVVQQLAAPAPSPVGPTAAGGVIGGRRLRRMSKRMWIILGSIIGGVVLLGLLALLFGYVRKCRRRKKIRRMEETAEWGVTLPMKSIGNTMAPVALQTRTRPYLENEFVP